MFSLFLQDAWKVLLYSLVLGAGLPVVYALGVRALAIGGAGADAADGAAPVVRRTPVGTALAAVCFLVVIAGVAIGLTYIVASGQGKMLSFEHVYPTLVPKG
ncbi:hypothetical protein [Nocardioides cynanchi]|uniref:hypothetical protein n=1 Tax=Nocardioides cynanchi TaxID=2558918 RepID=UPI001246904D|nr:hypothetical protein [Nocardioides cynanchi]